MSNRPCKAAVDCNGEVMEAITNVPLLVMTGNITDPDAIDAYNDMKQKWAKQYAKWKDKYVDFGDVG